MSMVRKIKVLEFQQQQNNKMKQVSNIPFGGQTSTNIHTHRTIDTYTYKLNEDLITWFWIKPNSISLITLYHVSTINILCQLPTTHCQAHPQLQLC